MRSCGEPNCEFTFEENAVGSIFAELKNYPDVCEFLLTTAILAFNAGSARDMTEPFPGFLLKNTQIRDKTGYLSNIKEARA